MKVAKWYLKSEMDIYDKLCAWFHIVYHRLFMIYIGIGSFCLLTPRICQILNSNFRKKEKMGGGVVQGRFQEVKNLSVLVEGDFF